MISSLRSYCIALTIALGAPNSMAADAATYDLSVSNIALLRNAAEAGDVKAQFTLGDIYDFGRMGALQDPALAFFWYKKAAEANYPIAKSMVAGLYLRGRGVSKNSKQGIYWLEQAARDGITSSQYELCQNYQFGWNLQVDLIQAYAWCFTAASKMPINKLGKFNLDRIKGSIKSIESRLNQDEFERARNLGLQYYDAYSFKD